MSKRANDDEINEEKSKHQKPNDAGPSGIAATAVDGMGVQNEESSSPICKLNAICCDDLFDWLSLTDLHSLGQTCRRMQRLTGSYFRENFKKNIYYRRGNIYYGNYDNWIQINGFIEFIQNIRFRYSNHHYNQDDFQYLGANCESLREISIKTNELSLFIKDPNKDKLAKIEIVRFVDTEHIPTWIYADFFKFCPNLKTLNMMSMNDSEENEWMCEEYPKLEHLMIDRYHSENVVRNFDVFLQKNRQLQCIEISHKFFRCHFDMFVNSDVKLDILIIDFDYMHENYIKNSEFADMCGKLNELYDKGFYKQLKLDLCLCLKASTLSTQIKQLAKVHGLEKLSFALEKNIVFTTIQSVKEIIISCYDWYNYNSIEVVTVSFPNLRKITLKYVTSDDLLRFVRRLPKLKEIFIKDEFIDNKSHIDLPILHKEREKLAGASKLTIYLPEHNYLETKMATKNLYTNHDMIEIKRIDLSKNPNFNYLHTIMLISNYDEMSLFGTKQQSI